MPRPGLYPSAITINLAKKQQFFLGDRWVEIGEVQLRVGLHSSEMQLIFPDINAFFAEQFALDNGAREWLDWGPRVN